MRHNKQHVLLCFFELQLKCECVLSNVGHRWLRSLLLIHTMFSFLNNKLRIPPGFCSNSFDKYIYDNKSSALF